MVPHRSATEVHVEICVAALDAHQTVSGGKQEDDKVKMSGDPHFRADTAHSKGRGCPKPGQWLRSVPGANNAALSTSAAAGGGLQESSFCIYITSPQKSSPGKRGTSILTQPAALETPVSWVWPKGQVAPRSSTDSRYLKVMNTKSFAKAQQALKGHTTTLPHCMDLNNSLWCPYECHLL